MYGGVSLAIYMNGAAQELLQFVRATASNPHDPLHARYSDEELRGSTALMYRELARLASIGQPAALDLMDPTEALRQRFVVDIVSGTSAGGINGVFLAKALANGQSLDGLSRLWQAEGDIGLLINDRDSLKGVPNLPRNKNPKSLLNSQRMYLKLLDALDEMDTISAQRVATPLVDELDLFLTTTDLVGLPVRLQLGAGEVAEERRYRKSFHLSFGNGRNDFEKVDNPFLAFISRCSSSFPVAFEPMQFKSAASLLQAMRRPLSSAERDRWGRHFAEYDADQLGSDPDSRPYADGGYLDNKPFSYAIDTIATRRGGDSGRIERKLLYVEPDPERLAVAPSSGEVSEPPNAVENALAVIRLRSYETIREELLRLRDRNRLVHKIRSVVAGVDDDFEALDPDARGRLAGVLKQRSKFGTRALENVVEKFGSAYGGYHRLKVAKLTDDLSQILATHAGISTESDEFRAVRLLVQAWRQARYVPNPEDPPEAQSEFRFLESFDLPYRIRRGSFVVDQINRLWVLSPPELAEEWRKHPSISGRGVEQAIALERPDELALEFNTLRSGLAEVLLELRACRDALQSPEPADEVEEIAKLAPEIKEAVARVMAQPTDRERDLHARQLVRSGAGGSLDAMLTTMQEAVAARVLDMVTKARSRCEELLDTDSTPQFGRPAPTTAKEVAQYISRHYYTWYELYDSMVFPIVYGSEVGEEIAIVEPIRISPLTGRTPQGLPEWDPKLMPSGLGAGHFGAFLNVEWRARDILIGRLNAAEKLIRMVLAGTPHNKPEVIETLLERAHSTILEEECARAGSIVGSRLNAVYNVGTPEQRLAFLKADGLQPTPLSPEYVVQWTGRAAKVLGKVLREASEQATAKRFAAALLYSGHLLTGMVEVLVPRQWWGIVLRLWVPRLLVFSLALILLGTLLGKEQVGDLGWTALMILLGLVTLTLTLRSWIRHQSSRVVRFLTSLVATAALVLLLVGVLYAPEAVSNILARMAQWGTAEWVGLGAATLGWLAWSTLRTPRS
jgi:patatin-related protein